MFWQSSKFRFSSRTCTITIAAISQIEKKVVKGVWTVTKSSKKITSFYITGSFCIHAEAFNGGLLLTLEGGLSHIYIKLLLNRLYLFNWITVSWKTGNILNRRPFRGPIHTHTISGLRTLYFVLITQLSLILVKDDKLNRENKTTLFSICRAKRSIYDAIFMNTICEFSSSLQIPNK